MRSRAPNQDIWFDVATGVTHAAFSGRGRGGAGPPDFIIIGFNPSSPK